MHCLFRFVFHFCGVSTYFLRSYKATHVCIYMMYSYRALELPSVGIGRSVGLQQSVAQIAHGGRWSPLFARGLIVSSVLDLMNFNIAVTSRQCACLIITIIPCTRLIYIYMYIREFDSAGRGIVLRDGQARGRHTKSVCVHNMYT